MASTRLFAGALLLLAGCGAPPPTGREMLSSLQTAVEASVDRVRPSLVYAEVSGGLILPQQEGPPRGGRGGPQAPQQIALTGIVLSPDGIILLPIALKADAVERIRVWVGSAEHSGTVAEVDERAGISLVRIQPGSPLTPAQFAPTSARRGEWVSTVAALGEQLDFQTVCDFGVIQGFRKGEQDQLFLGGGLANSAGGVFGTVVTNLDGQVLGVSRGRMGVVSMTDQKQKLDRMVAKIKQPPAGGATASADDKPWLGLQFDPINEELAEALHLPKEAVWAQAVYRGSPAEKGGIQAGDLITGVNGTPIAEKGRQALPALLKLLAPEIGRSVELQLIREGHGASASLTFAKRPEPRTLKAEDIGVVVEEISPERFYQLGLSRSEGIFASQIIPGSPAATSGSMSNSLIRLGDVITELAGVPIRNLDDFSSAAQKIRDQKLQTPLVKLQRGVLTTHAALNMKLGTSEGGN